MSGWISRVAVALVGLSLAGGAGAAELAAPQPGRLGLVGELVLEFGGDSVGTVLFTDGSTQKVRTGQGGTLALGGHFQPAGSPFDLVGTIGWKFVTTKASDSDIGINRAVIQLLGLYDPSGEFWIGGGPVLHAGTRFSGGGLAEDVSFGSSLGLTVQAGWRWIGVTYTVMRYEGGGATYDASAAGVSVRWRG
jgi:hypothetical protein